MSTEHENKLSEAIVMARGNLSQQAFATLIGTTVLTLREWEKGRRAPGLYRHVEALADQGVPLELLRAGAATTKAMSANVVANTNRKVAA